MPVFVSINEAQTLTRYECAGRKAKATHSAVPLRPDMKLTVGLVEDFRLNPASEFLIGAPWVAVGSGGSAA